ncbi:SGNH/GDSL hydrolase family protein [Halalkalibacter okhensis]|uniref:SGNH hydrolase-type esterase domain-containing protein n=1 Tax=Halalkalibacter okhensis TaxID=333138 RepID=A0A0B0I9D9_9BACI|nr:SGNH/GDSL hydrolase family protein [Halalkalibacter okhensis]KHF39148.1 hypothetical protein LQ50_17125 [Halalkalibacter okhensis]
MKNVWFIGLVCLSILGVIFGHHHYKDKLETIAVAAKDVNVEVSEVEPDELDGEEEQSFSMPKESLIDVGGVVGYWLGQKGGEEPIRVSYFGSKSLVYEADSSKSWTSLVTSELESELGEESITATVIEVGEERSIDVLYSDYVDDVIESAPDILVVEPLLLNDAGVIGIEDSLSNMKKVLATIKEELPDTSIIMTPANPLLDAGYYVKKTEVDLVNFAKKEEYEYANHWKIWPSPDNKKELQKYLNDRRPSEAGHEVWGEFVVGYLMGRW